MPPTEGREGEDRDWFAPVPPPPSTPAPAQHGPWQEAPAAPSWPPPPASEPPIDQTGVWRPPAAAPRPRRPVWPDVRVWPPPEEPVGESGPSTQPFPAVRASALPIPQARPPAEAVPPPAPAAPPQPVASRPDAPRKRARRLGWTLLKAVAAVVLLALAAAVPTLDGYRVYKEGRPDDIIHVVRPGQTYAFKHVAWRATVAPMRTLPEGLPPKEGRTWMQITVTRKALDQEGLLRSGDPEMELRDARGRAWVVQITDSEVPPETEDAEIGAEYRYTAIGLVPTPMADEVELYLRPSVYRRDRSVKELLEPTGERPLDVLRFMR